MNDPIGEFCDAIMEWCNGNAHLADIIVTWAIQPGPAAEERDDE